MSFKSIAFGLIVGLVCSRTFAQNLSALPTAERAGPLRPLDSASISACNLEPPICSDSETTTSDLAPLAANCYTSFRLEESENPAGAAFVSTQDDGPFGWLWEVDTTTRSIYEDQASRVKPKPSTHWFDLFPSKKEAPKSPAIQLENLSPFPAKKSVPAEQTMWQSTKERWAQWNHKMKESTQRSWSSLKERLSGE